MTSTINYYDENADDFIASTIDVDMTSLYERFLKYIPDHGTLLDAGCGSGRDVKAFMKLGYKLHAFDASVEMSNRASQHTGMDVKVATFLDFKFESGFDGVWCCASLLHVAFTDLHTVLCRLKEALLPNGVIYVSFKYGDIDMTKGGRSFTNMTETRLLGVLDRVSTLSIQEVWQTDDERPGRGDRWLNAILQLI